ncbi:MAG: hypothetical protein ACRD88_04305 [Terriglobia bacterium]
MLTGLVSTVFLVVAALNPATPPPAGFRYPTEADRSLDWKTFEARLPTPFHAQADLNGDGLPDHAWILLRKSGKGWGLFVFIGQKGERPAVLKLEEDNGQTAAQRLGVHIVEPGEYDTACGKGYWDCEPDEPEKLKLVLPAIDFFTFESANSYFWWNAESKKFARTWMSD